MPATYKDRQLLCMENGDELTLYHHVGCPQCNHTGFRNRVGIFELIIIDNEIKTMIHRGEDEQTMLKEIRKKSPSILNDGLKLVRQGRTSLDEVLRVTMYDQ